MDFKTIAFYIYPALIIFAVLNNCHDMENFGWGPGEWSMSLWKKLAEGHGDRNIPLCGLMAPHESTKLLEGDCTQSGHLGRGSSSISNGKWMCNVPYMMTVKELAPGKIPFPNSGSYSCPLCLVMQNELQKIK